MNVNLNMNVKGNLKSVNGDTYHLHFSSYSLEHVLNSDHNRLKCTIGEEVWYSTLFKQSNDDVFISIPVDIAERLGIKENEYLDIDLEEDHRVYRCSVPDEIIDELIDNPKVENVFHSQSESIQRSLIYKIKRIAESSERKKRARAALFSLL